MLDDVYTGTLGTFFNREELVFKLNELMTKVGGSLSYEVVEQRTKVVILTGVNDTEQDVPSFQHPLIFKTIRGEDAVAIDMRPFMKSKLVDMITVREKLQDKYNGMLMLYRLILTKLLLDGETFLLGSLHNPTMEAFSSIVKTTTSMLLYDESIKEPVELVSDLHFISMDMTEDVKDKTKIIELLPRDKVAKILKGDYSYIYNKILDDTITLPSTTIGSLTTNIREAINNKRAKGLTADILMQSLSRGFYSLDSRDLAIAMVEDKPTLTALLYMTITESINSKGAFNKVIHGNSRFIKPKEFAKSFLNIVNSQLVDG